MPLAAALSLHARVHDVTTSVLERNDLAQVWGPGFSAYVVATDDVAVFTLGHRSLHIFGPATIEDFSRRAGVSKRHADAVVAALDDELVPATIPGGPAVLLPSDAAAIEGSRDTPADGVRLLPSGGAYYLLHGSQRDTLMPEAPHQAEL